MACRVRMQRLSRAMRARPERFPWAILRSQSARQTGSGRSEATADRNMARVSLLLPE